MKAVIDKEACIGCGLCPSMCPEVYEMGDDGKAFVKVDTVPKDVEASAREAAEACPTEAIKIQ
jgi:ferredoxin